MIDRNVFKPAAEALEPRAFEAVAGKHVGHAIEASGTAVQEHVRRAASAHRRTGKLEKFVGRKVAGRGLATTVDVHASGRVAHLITGGTAAHDISPIAARAISMTAAGGALVGFAGSVHHPGTKADPFVARGVADAAADVARIVDAAGTAIVRDLARAMTSRGRP
jgi:hypothetical protein